VTIAISRSSRAAVQVHAGDQIQQLRGGRCRAGSAAASERDAGNDSDDHRENPDGESP
jgi:hypothetical protein